MVQRSNENAIQIYCQPIDHPIGTLKINVLIHIESIFQPVFHGGDAFGIVF